MKVRDRRHGMGWHDMMDERWADSVASFIAFSFRVTGLERSYPCALIASTQILEMSV